MSRYGNNHSSNSTIAAANTMLISISAKEESYKQSIAKNHAYCKNIASRLTINNDTDGIDTSVSNSTTVEDVLTKIFSNHNENQNHNEGSQQQSNTIGTSKVQDFLQEQRERLKNITKQNLEDERTISLFCTSLKTLQTDHLSPTTNTDKNDTTSNNEEKEDKENAKESENETETETMKDYQILLEQIMIQESEKQQQNQINIEHEVMYRDMCTTLGEPLSKTAGSTTGTSNSTSSSGRKKRGKNVIADDDDDDNDDDLVCISRTNKTTIESLKCPITGMLLDDPVKNKVCHHTYSREGIMNHIAVNNNNKSRIGGGHAQCPVFGCSNTNVTIDQLEIDYDMVLKIRQEKRHQQSQIQSQQSNISNIKSIKHVIDDDDDDNNANDNNDVGEEEL